MPQIEYTTKISSHGNIPIPDKIKKKLLLRPNNSIKVTIEISDSQKEASGKYSFQKVRKLLSPIKDDLSKDIVADREDRV